MCADGPSAVPSGATRESYMQGGYYHASQSRSPAPNPDGPADVRRQGYTNRRFHALMDVMSYEGVGDQLRENMRATILRHEAKRAGTDGK